MAKAALLAGPHLACRPGCTECCIGPFSITELDAHRLRRGLRELKRADPPRAARVAERAARAAAAMQPFAGEKEDGLAVRFAGLACPALDPAGGTCDLYAWRPISCRTFGPPVRFGVDAPPPCRLCFTEAAAAEVERCRVEVDPEGLEEALLEEIGGPATLVAFALASGEPS